MPNILIKISNALYRSDVSYSTILLHTLTLWGFVVAQPLFDLFSKNTSFFVAYDASAREIALLTLFLSFLFPAGLALLVCLVKTANSRAGLLLHNFVMATLFLALCSLLVNQLASISEPVSTYIVILLSIAVFLLYLFVNSIKGFINLLSISILIFPVTFIFFSPVKQLISMDSALHEPAETSSKITDTPIIFVIFDEMPLVSLLNKDMLISDETYPNFSELASQANWFRNYTVNAVRTLTSIPAMLSGNYPSGKIRPLKADNFGSTLFTLLGPHYKIYAVGFSEGMVPAEYKEEFDLQHRGSIHDRLLSMLLDMSVVHLHMSLPIALTSELPPVTDNWNKFVMDSVPGEASPFEQIMLAIKARPNDPTLYYLHSMVTHNPWSYTPSGREFSEKTPGYVRDKKYVNAVAGFGGKRWSRNKWLVTQGYQRHLLNMQYADTMLGELLTRLRDLGIYDKSLIIVTSDHGASFEAGQKNRGKLSAAPGDTMPVPLIVKTPFQRTGSISDDNIESIDLLPTIMDVLGMKFLKSVDGESAFDMTRVDRPTKKLVYYSWNTKRNPGKVLDKELITAAKNSVLAQRLQHKISIFGNGESNDSHLFNIGPYGNLVGKSIESLTVIDEHRFLVSTTINQSKRFRHVNIENPRNFPALISGEVLGGAKHAKPMNIAIAINQVIRAVTKTFSENSGSKHEYYAVLPEDALIEGYNQIDLYLITKDKRGQTRISLITETSS